VALEQKIVERAAAAARDEQIFVAGEFLPSDLEVIHLSDPGGELSTGTRADVDAWGGSHGGIDRLPLVVMAVSPTNLYLLVTEPGEGILTADRYTLVETIDRESLRVSSVEVDDVHELIIEDAAAIRVFKRKSSRAGSHFLEDVLNALRTDEHL
jgi:hypothetical protein